MIQNSKFKILNSSKGTTLVELVVVIFMVALFSMIMISDFPKILRQFALSRTAYKLAQDLRKVEDLGLSGALIEDGSGVKINAKGYGLYKGGGDNMYIMYADVENDQKYVADPSQSCDLSTQARNTSKDCYIEIVNVSSQNSDLIIKGISGIKKDGTSVLSVGSVSINFMPPGPTVKITGSDDIVYSSVVISLGLNSDAGATRGVSVNTSGLINVQ